MPERFSASNAAKHMACHASANLDLAIPGWVAPVRDDMAGAAGEGTRMHEIFAGIMEYPAKDIRHLATVLEYIAELRSTRRFKVLIEETVVATWLASQPKTTADLVLYTADEIHVLDLKWGKIPVDVWDNEQLMFYAVCFAPLAPRAKGVTTHILQPRADNMSSQFVDTNQLAAFMDEAMKAEAAINAGSVTFGPSDHCKFCPANPHSRADKGTPLCPPMLRMLYPPTVNEDEILGL